MRSKKAIINILSSVSLQVVTIICGFITPILIIKSYGSEVNGLVSSITQFLAYITLLEAGFGPVLKSVLYKPIANKQKDEIAGILKSGQKFFHKISYIFIGYIVILAIVYPFVLNNQFDFIFTLSLVLIISISNFFEYYFGITYKLFLQAEQKTYVTSNIQLIALIGNTVITVLLIKLGFGIHVVKLVSALIYISRPIIQSIYVQKKYDIDIKNAKEIKIKNRWQGLSQHIAAVIHNNTDVTILTLFSKNMAEISVYSVYYLVVTGIKKIIQSFTGGIDASFGDMYVKEEYENLKRSFRIYELFFHTITTIVFTCCIILIVPFVSVYTKDVSDVNYIRPLFGCLIVLSEFMYSIRLPYSSLTLAVGHFKETMKGAWVESIVNITLSIILVIKFGIVGVAIGTLAAMLIRTFEFMYHTSKYVLKSGLVETFKRLPIIVSQVLIAVLICQYLPLSNITNYFNWALYATLVFAITLVIVVGINYIFYRNDFAGLKNIFKRNLKRNKKN